MEGDVEAHPAQADARRGGHVAELAGTDGRIGVEVDGKPVGELRVADGHVELVGESAPTQGVVAFASAEDFWKILRGELNPIVCALQGRLAIQGDLAFTIRVVLAIAAHSPFKTGQAKGS